MQRVNGGEVYETWTFVKANVFFAVMTRREREIAREVNERSPAASKTGEADRYAAGDFTTACR